MALTTEQIKQYNQAIDNVQDAIVELTDLTLVPTGDDAREHMLTFDAYIFETLVNLKMTLNIMKVKE